MAFDYKAEALHYGHQSVDQVKNVIELVYP